LTWQDDEVLGEYLEGSRLGFLYFDIVRTFEGGRVQLL